MSYFNMNDNHDMITSKQLDYNRFYNILLIKKIAMIFYDNKKVSLKHQFHIQFLFHKITSSAVILIAIKIRHCFIKYQHDIKKQTIKFKNFTIENKTFLIHHISIHKSLTIIVQ